MKRFLPFLSVTRVLCLVVLLAVSACDKASRPAAANPSTATALATKLKDAPSLTGVSGSLAVEHPMEILGPLGGKLDVVAADVVVAGSKLRVVRELAPDQVLSGELGKGWRLNWESRLTRGDDGQDAILLDGGGVAVFVKDGEQLTAKGVGTLALSADGAVLTRMDGGSDTFDRDGRLIERRMGSDAATLHYDSLGRLGEVTASDGGSVKFRHDDSGRLVEAKASDGSAARYGYTDAPLPVGVSASWSYSYDEAGQLSSLSGTAAGETHFKYDATGRVTSRSWAAGGTERFDYDDAQHSVRHTAENGQVLTSQWSEDGRKLTMTDAAGAKAVQEFNAAGQMVSVTGEKGRAAFEYDALGRLATTTGADGAKQSFAYLGATKLPVSISGPDGKRELTYDSQRNLTAVDDGKGRAEFGYDKEGRLVSTKLPGGESWNYAYDEKGRRKSATDAQGKVTEFRHDEAGRLAGETLTDGTSAGYEYGAGGQLAAITGADGARRTFAYDAAGQIVSHEDSATGNMQALQSRLEQLEASRGSGTAPVPTVPRPIVAVAAKTVKLPVSPGFEPTVARPAINPTVATPVPVEAPSTSSQVASGAGIGRAAAGGLIVAANIYSSVQEGKPPREIAHELAWTGVRAAGMYAAGVVAGAVLSPVALGVGAVAATAATGYGTYRAAIRAGDSVRVGAERQRAAYEPAERTLTVMFRKLGELRALRAQLTANITEINTAGNAGPAALAAAEAAAAELPPDAPPLTRQRVFAFSRAAEDGAVKKTEAAAGASRAEAWLEVVKQKLDAVDPIANSANPSAPEIENALNLFAGAQALVAGVVKAAGEVNATATALRTASAEAKSAPAVRDAALAKLTPADTKVAAFAPLVSSIQRVQNAMRPTVVKYQNLANELISFAGQAASQLAGAPTETQGLLARRTAEIQQAVDWKPDAEIAAALEFAKSAAPRVPALQAQVQTSRTFLYKIPSDLTVPTADDEARRATAASTAAQQRLAASAALIQKLRSMGAEVDVPTVAKVLKGAEAKAKFIAAGFTNVTIADSGRAPGPGEDPFLVVQQSPAGGTKARPSTAVTLTVLRDKVDASNNMPATTAKLKVPEGLRGMTEADAIAKVRAAGFTSVATVAANSPTPDGKGDTVDDYVPAGGLERDASTTVTLYIFPKPGEAIVPDVHGLTVQEAKLQIEGVKLKTGVQASSDQPPPTAKELTVQYQSHPSGTKLKIGEVVTLTIYPYRLASDETIMPGVRGLSADAAKSRIEAAKLKAVFQGSAELPPEKAQEFTVEAQSKATGAKLKIGEVVTLSMYPKFGTTPANTVPNFVGTKSDEVFALIRSAGLEVGASDTIATVPKDQQDKAGTVIRQTPAAGQPIPEDKRVSIVAYGSIQRAGGGDNNIDRDMADAAARDSSKLVGRYTGTHNIVQAQGQLYGAGSKLVNQDKTPVEISVSIDKTSNIWSVSVSPTAVANKIFVSFSGADVVKGQSIIYESKGSQWHTICKIVYDNGVLTGNIYKEDLGYKKATGKRWFNSSIFSASRVP